MSKKKEFTLRQDMFTRLDKLVPLVGLGIAAYAATRAARDAAEQLPPAATNGGVPDDGVAAFTAPQTTPAIPAPMREDEAAAQTAPVATSSPKKRFDLTKKILLLAMLAGIIALVVGGGTFATFSAETGNPQSSVAAGTLTMSDQVNTGMVCNSYGANSQDNYNAACDSILSLANQAPGQTDTSGTYVGGYAKVTIKNTGSINASLFSMYAPYVNARLSTPVTAGSTVGTGQTVTSFSTTAVEGPVATNDKIVLNFGSVTQQFCAGAPAAAGATSITISGGYPAGSTGSCPASVGSTTLNGGINASQTSITVTSFASFPGSGNYVITIDSEQMLVTGGQGTTTWTVTRGYNGTTATTHSNGATTGQVVIAGSLFDVGTRLNDTSTNTGPTNTDCYDTKTTSSPISGATYGTQLNFNSTTGNPFCSSALLWIQEQSTVGASTYNYCWFGRGSQFGDQGGNTEDSNGQCRTPTQMTLASNVTTGAATTTTLNGGINNSTTSVTVANGASFSNGDTVVVDSEEMTIVSGGTTNSWTVATRGTVNGTNAATHLSGATVTKTTTTSLNVGGSLYGNIRTNDQITLAESGSTLTCYSTAPYYIGSSSNISVQGCYGTPSTTFDGSAIVRDSTAFTALNGSNPSSTISNFDTAHLLTGAIYMPPLTGNGTDNPVATVQLAAHGDANSKDIRIFYVGVYFPAPAGTNQNGLQGLLSTFGLTYHIDQ